MGWRRIASLSVSAGAGIGAAEETAQRREQRQRTESEDREAARRGGEETAQRRERRQRTESEDREASRAATATKEGDKFEEAAAEIMRTKPTRCPPDVVLEHPPQASPQYHEDRTVVDGSNRDPESRSLSESCGS